MCLSISSYNCKSCDVPLCRDEIIRSDNTRIVVKSESRIAAKVQINSFIITCGWCREIVGTVSQSSDTYRFDKNKIYKYTYQN